jgi:hypothetical protein
MKRLLNLTLVTAVFATSAYASKSCPTGQVSEVHGEVSRESPLQARVERLKAGECISDGAAIITKKGATAHFHLTSPASVSLAPEGELLVGFPIGGRPTKLNLTRGEVRISSEVSDPTQEPSLYLLRMTVVANMRGTTFLAQSFRDGQEGWVVVTQGSVSARLGNAGSAVIVKAGQSIYFTDEQKEVPRVVPLDERELSSLEHDRNFKQTISQLLMVESGAGENKDQDLDEGDVTLQDYAAQLKAREQERRKAPVPSAQPSSQVMAEIVRPTAVKEQNLLPQSPVKPQLSLQSPDAARSSSLRLDLGTSFYGDAAGMEFSGEYLTPATHIFKSLEDRVGIEGLFFGAGAGYSHASKNDLSVNNWKFFLLANYRFNVSRVVTVAPEFDMGFGLEDVHTTETSFANGGAFYYSPRVATELNVARAPYFHPGIIAGIQQYVGGTSLLSAILELTARFDF